MMSVSLFLPLSWAVASPLLSALPTWYVYGFAFLIGATVGSFLNVCILRIPEEGVSIFYPRHSRCPVCHTQIAWFDNIPILSWLALRGKCRTCKTPISLQYPLVELLTAVMAVAVVKRFGLQPVSLVWFALICSLIVITFIDMAWWIIPDVISLPAIPLGIVLAYVVGDPMPSWQSAVWGAVLGGGLFLLISQGYVWLTGRQGMGMGDAKLLGMIGAFLGWKVLPLVILLASAQGLLAAVLLYSLGWRQGVPEDLLEPEHDHGAKSAEVSSPSHPGEITTQQAQPGSESPSELAHPTNTTVHHEASPTDESPDAAFVSEKIEQNGTSHVEEGHASEQDMSFRRVAIPFGPFLSLAAIEVLFWGESIFVFLGHYLRFSW